MGVAKLKKPGTEKVLVGTRLMFTETGSDSNPGSEGRDCAMGAIFITLQDMEY